MVSVVETVEKPVESNGDNIDSTIHLLEVTRQYNTNLKNSSLRLLQLFMVIYQTCRSR